MKYIETEDPIDEEDKMIYFQEFRKVPPRAILLGSLGFFILWLDFISYANYQSFYWYSLVFSIPIYMFLSAYKKFKSRLNEQTKHVTKATILDKKYYLHTKRIVNDEGRIENQQTHQYLFFIEGKDQAMEVDAEMFHFFQVQDIMKLSRRNTYDIVYRYEKYII